MEMKDRLMGNVTFQGSVTFQGPMFDIHDNQHVHVNVNKQPQENDEEVDDDVEPMAAEVGGEMVEKLKPLFYNNEADVRLFLKEIDGMKDNDITDLVNRWVREKRISDYGNSRKGVLWGILHDAGLYDKTVQNWNRRVF